MKTSSESLVSILQLFFVLFRTREWVAVYTSGGTADEICELFLLLPIISQSCISNQSPLSGTLSTAQIKNKRERMLLFYLPGF